jgi:hypothetical protein
LRNITNDFSHYGFWTSGLSHLIEVDDYKCFGGMSHLYVQASLKVEKTAQDFPNAMENAFNWKSVFSKSRMLVATYAQR